MSKIAVITGASSGMGKEFAIQIANKFQTIDEIWLIARREERLKETAGLVKAKGKKVKILVADLTKESSFLKIQNELQQHKPKVRILVNAAGFGLIGHVNEIDCASQSSMVDCNCKALLNMTQIILPYMSSPGNIIQLASSAAFLPQPSFAVYAASKSFVLSFSRALNEELKPKNITVTAVCPGPVKTEFFDIAEKEHEIKIYKKVFMVKAKNVVSKALKDSVKGKTVSVYGITMKAFRILTKFLPHSILVRFIR